MKRQKKNPEVDDERYDGSGYNTDDSGSGFGKATTGFDNLNDMFGKFAQSFTGGRRQAAKKPPKKKRTFDDNNFRMLVSIAEKQLVIVGILFFLMVGVNFFLKQYNLLSVVREPYTVRDLPM